MLSVLAALICEPKARKIIAYHYGYPDHSVDNLGTIGACWAVIVAINGYLYAASPWMIMAGWIVGVSSLFLAIGKKPTKNVTFSCVVSMAVAMAWLIWRVAK